MAKDTVSLFNKYARGLFRKAAEFSPEHVQMEMPSKGGKQSRVSTNKAKQANKEVEKQDANAQVLTIETPDEPQPLTQPLTSCSAFELGSVGVLEDRQLDSSLALCSACLLRAPGSHPASPAGTVVHITHCTPGPQIACCTVHCGAHCEYILISHVAARLAPASSSSGRQIRCSWMDAK